MPWFRKYYRHNECDANWTDTWSCACNDKCPACGAEIEPFDCDDLTVVVDRNVSGRGWVVSVSPPDAEQTPRYVRHYFEENIGASEFAARETRRLGREPANTALNSD